ncbi:hypothetical protein EVAR_60079_1 [Eumeta japonica]|uniref:Uncharacterized protein n=1 Tax=Eumeta variegata TaxID=151549 RepID=A0A4C1YHX6_EUMVA|nr:hypothetical protein EVAR_60079_1 [Eumeta japonica]
MKREEGRREAADRTSRLLEREAELAAVYAPPPPRQQLSERTRRIAERAPRRREAFKVNTQTEVTASVRSARPSISSPRDAFKALNSDEKWDFVKRENSVSCITKRTRARTARRATARAAHLNESAISETVTNIGTGESKALLKIVPVTIRAADREIKVHALLDDGATVTLLDDMSRVISTPKDRGPMSHDHATRSAVAVTTADEISSHRHLNECHLEAFQDARPLLLIGQDNGNSSPAATSGVENQVSQSRL